MQENRSDKSTKNLLYGIIAQLIQSIFPFAARTVFIYTLDQSYLGISSLFTSILTVLSLAELGLNNIVIYSLYKPVAERNHNRIVALINFYKTIYSCIAVVVFIIGIVLIPFLKYLINLPDGIDHLYLYYFLYVLNSSLSYLFVYKTAIIDADQKRYIISKYTAISMISLYTVQIFSLLLFHNFLFFLVIQIFFSVGQNIVLSLKADKLYNLNTKDSSKLNIEEKKKIFSDAKAMLMYKLGGTFLNSTDSMYISALVSTITVGLYANYTLLENLLNKFINLIYDAVIASVGNLNAIENIKKQKFIFDTLTMLFIWMGTVGSVGYFTAVNNIISIWLGNTYCIDTAAVGALTLRFYLPIVLYPIWMYRNTTGIFRNTQGILIYAGILNLILSYILGVQFGLAGILFATSVSRILTSFWYEPKILYKNIFSDYHVWEYFEKIFFSLFTIFVTVFLIRKIEIIYSANIYIHLIIKLIVSIFFPTFIFLLKYAHTNELNYLFNTAKRIINKKYMFF